MTKMVVTPWEVSGKIDYDKLVKEFGTQHLSEALMKRIGKLAGRSHFMLRRKVFFSHRDMDVVLDEYEKGKKFALYTGRGPSGMTHIGHMLPWVFCKYLQDAFDVPLYFQITDDEKFLHDPKLSLEETNRLGYENALDVIALGFDPKKTFIFVDTDYGKTMYRTALMVAKRVTTSTAKAVFGFTNETNIGMTFWPAMQAAPCFLPSVLQKKKVRTLIPAAIDQDPYWRISRDVAPKLGYPKTAAIHNTFLPGLEGPDSKMSASKPFSAIFTTDEPELAREKIMKSFSGGAKTLKEHRKKGGNPEVDTACQYLRQMFEESDKKVEDTFAGYRNGSLSSGDVKGYLADKVGRFLKNHQKERERAKRHLDRFLLKD